MKTSWLLTSCSIVLATLPGAPAAAALTLGLKSSWESSSALL